MLAPIYHDCLFKKQYDNYTVLVIRFEDYIIGIFFINYNINEYNKNL